MKRAQAGDIIAVHGPDLRVLISGHDIEQRLDAMAAELEPVLEWRDAFAVIALKGAVVFAADLLRRLPPVDSLDYIQARSYGSGTASSGQVQLVRDTELSVDGRTVVLLDDITDTGLTSSFLRSHLLARGADEVHVVTLLDKPARRRVRFELAATGFEIADDFVVGYGLDYGERFRTLPFVAVLGG